MKISKLLIWLPAILCSLVLHSHAQESIESQSPPKYQMKLVYIFETESPEFIYVIGSIGFKTVASLKNYLSTMPHGSILEWAPGCRRIVSEPLLSSEQEMEDFKAFCAEKGITFILVPSG
jgi:hypothetical protein